MPVETPALRRVVGIVLVAALLVVLVAGLVHLGGGDDHGVGPHDCGLCLALLQIAVALPALGAWSQAARLPVGRPSAAPVRVARPARRVGVPLSRGPPRLD